MDDELRNYLNQGISLMTLEKYDKAIPYFNKVIEQLPRDTEAYFHLGNAYVNMEKYDDALNIFKKILIIDKNNAEAYFALGNVELLMEDNIQAIEYYNKAENLGYSNADLYEILANIYLESEDETQALRYLSKAISKKPFDGELRLYKIRIYLADGRFDEALENLDEMERILPDSFEVYNLKSQILCEKGQFDYAIETINKGVARFPNDINILLARLRLYVKMEKNNEAKKLIQELKDKGLYEKFLKDCSLEEATVYINDKDIDKAISILKNADEKLDDVDIAFVLMDIYSRKNNFEEVKEYSSKLLNKEIEDFYLANALFLHATALENLGEVDLAKKEYKSITTRLRRITVDNPDFYEGYIFRLLSHTKIGEFEKALELADYLYDLDDEGTDSFAYKYYIYKEMGDINQAEENKKKALEINPDLVL